MPFDSGVEVALSDGAQGFIRKAELSRDRSEQRPDRFAVGDKLDAKITVIDAKTRKILTTLKDENGSSVQSEKMVEVVFDGERPVRTGDQFGLGRKR